MSTTQSETAPTRGVLSSGRRPSRSGRGDRISYVLVLVDVVIDDRSVLDARPTRESVAQVELRDVTEVDASATVLARNTATVAGTASRWLATTELALDETIDRRADLTVWVRITESPDDDLAVGDWITMQSVPVDPSLTEQRVTAPVRRVG